MANLSTVTDANFDNDVIAASSKVPVLVDFWAEWCGPCKMLAPVLDELSTELAGKLQVVKLDVDANPKAAQAYQVMSIPTMILFKDGKPAQRLVGFKKKEQLSKELNAVLV